MRSLATIPRGTRVFVDTNILALSIFDDTDLGMQCSAFLARIERHELVGFTSTTVAAELTHRVMINEARDRLALGGRETVEYMQKYPEFVRSLTKHLQVMTAIGTTNIDILPLTVRALHTSKDIRREAGLLTNDSLIAAVMRNHKLRHLATHDAAFERVRNVEVWRPGVP